MISESEEEAKRERVPITRDGNSKLARSARVSIEKACREDAQTAMAGALEVKFWMPEGQRSRPSAVPGGWRLPIRPRPPRDGVTLPTCAPVWNRRWLSLLVIRCPYDAPTPMDSSAGSLATDPGPQRIPWPSGPARAEHSSDQDVIAPCCESWGDEKGNCRKPRTTRAWGVPSSTFL